MKHDNFLIKIVPPKGYTVYRLELGRHYVAVLCGLALLLLAGAVGTHFYQLRAARAHAAELEALAATQRAKLSTIDAQAGRLSSELRRLERQNAEIRRAVGIAPPSKRTSTHAAGVKHTTSFRAVESHLARVALESERAQSETQQLRHMVARILNVRRIVAIAHAQMLASIPSLVPAGTGAIASPFGYRSSPYAEFHRGVDLEADYGDLVRAAAKGVVVSAGWDGGYGYKVDIDHGNGLHTWYCHLSRMNVHEGQTVVKGEPIALVGSTGEATGPHLHYQVMRDGTAIDPGPFLSGKGAVTLGLR